VGAADIIAAPAPSIHRKKREAGATSRQESGADDDAVLWQWHRRPRSFRGRASVFQMIASSSAAQARSPTWTCMYHGRQRADPVGLRNARTGAVADGQFDEQKRHSLEKVHDGNIERAVADMEMPSWTSTRAETGTMKSMNLGSNCHLLDSGKRQNQRR
jgi:hypothetical protein